MVLGAVMARTGAAALRSKRSRFWPVVLVLAVLATGAWAGYTRPWEVRPKSVAVEVLASAPASRVLAVNGRIVPGRSIDVRPTVGGQLLSLGKEEGDPVAAGDVLATIDDAQQQAAVQQASAALDAALAQRGQAQLDFDRAESLGDTISRKAAEDARLGLETATRDAERLGAARDQAQSRLKEYVITAPFAGTVLARGVDPGQVVDSASVIYQIADLSQLQVEATVDELYAAEIRRGLKARLQPTGFNRTIESEVTFVSPSVDSSTGGRKLRIPVPTAADLSLPVGLTVTTNIVVEELDDALTVPRAAISDQRGRPFVRVIVAGKAERRDVEFVDWPAGRVIVTGGLAAGDTVILDPTQVADGALVVARAP